MSSNPTSYVSRDNALRSAQVSALDWRLVESAGAKGWLGAWTP